MGRIVGLMRALAAPRAPVSIPSSAANPSRSPAPAAHGGRGRLKIFLGYAAGVGKTYAMLEAANQRRREGIDVVVGCAETHDHPETEALLADLESCPSLPRAEAPGARPDLDLDALLARRPQLAVVDELAHSNAPGRRHARRYQSVEELLGAGIDVYTTVNVQQIESLKDVVAQITGVAVADTVPDRIIDLADSVELVDLPPDELLHRLEEGKVFVPDPSDPGVRRFYREGNLTALREMALRHTAARVDDQMRAYKRAHAISYTWAATERLLVCISASPLSERLVRTGRRLADQLSAEWFVLYIATPGASGRSEEARDRVARTMRLAEELGAKTDIVPGPTPAAAILEYARSHNVTKIVVGKSWGARWSDLLRGSVVDQLTRHSAEIDIYVISATARPPRRLARFAPRVEGSQRGYWYGAALVALVSLIGQPIRAVIDPTNLVMLYLLVVVITAARWGRGPSVLTAILSVLAFDFFLVPPRFTLTVSDAPYLLTFMGLLVVGLVISTLAARGREQAKASRERETYTAALYDLSRDLATALNLSSVIGAAIRNIGELFDCETGIFLARGGALVLEGRSARFPDRPVGEAAAGWAFRSGQVSGFGTETMPDAEARYLPLNTAQGTIGVVGIRPRRDSGEFLRPNQQRLLDALLSQLALAAEAVQLADKARQAQVMRETEKLQSALLNSVSHNLRTPLASITGALSSLRDDSPYLSEPARADLLATAWEEAEHLNRLVGNLLNMTRLEAGAMKLALEETDAQDLVGVALAQLVTRLRSRRLVMDVPANLPIVVDLVLAAQAVVNLIDNAAKYSPPDAPITIRAQARGTEVVIEVADEGPGIPPGELPHVFDKFYRVHQTADAGGAGLGLSISKGILELHGGRLWAENRPGGGAVFAAAFPLADAAQSGVSA